MNNESYTNSIILVVEDISETRDGIEKLLIAERKCLTVSFRNPT